MGSPHGFVVGKNKLTMFGAHCPFITLSQLAESKVFMVFPETTAPATIALITTFAINRTASILGLASTLYQYRNNLFGTQSFDVIMSVTTTITESFPGSTNIASAHIEFWYTFYRTLGGPLP